MWSDATGVWEQGEKGDAMRMQGAGWGGLSWVLPVERKGVRLECVEANEAEGLMVGSQHRA